jgi:hypothetical protein
MICCGSGFGKVLVPVPAPALIPVPVPDPDNVKQFSKNLKVAQNLVFSMPEAAYFPESWPLIFYFLILFITF